MKIGTEIGDIYVTISSRGISEVSIKEKAKHSQEVIPQYLQKYMDSGDISSLEFDLEDCTPFQRSVLIQTLKIPKGTTKTYSQIANEIKKPKASRAVGNALAANRIPYLIPCHRVIRSDGKIGNYALGKDLKKKLLEIERAI